MRYSAFIVLFLNASRAMVAFAGPVDGQQIRDFTTRGIDEVPAPNGHIDTATVNLKGGEVSVFRFTNGRYIWKPNANPEIEIQIINPAGRSVYRAYYRPS